MCSVYYNYLLSKHAAEKTKKKRPVNVTRGLAGIGAGITGVSLLSFIVANRLNKLRRYAKNSYSNSFDESINNQLKYLREICDDLNRKNNIAQNIIKKFK